MSEVRALALGRDDESVTVERALVLIEEPDYLEQLVVELDPVLDVVVGPEREGQREHEDSVDRAHHVVELFLLPVL